MGADFWQSYKEKKKVARKWGSFFHSNGSQHPQQRERGGEKSKGNATCAPPCWNNIDVWTSQSLEVVVERGEDHIGIERTTLGGLEVFLGSNNDFLEVAETCTCWDEVARDNVLFHTFK